MTSRKGLPSRVRDWEESRTKPQWLTPLMIHIVSRLIWAEADCHAVNHSYTDFAESACVHYNTVDAALDQLAHPPQTGAKPFLQLNNRRGASCDIALTSEYLKYIEKTPVVSDEALQLVTRFTNWQSKNVKAMSRTQRHRFRRKGYADQQIANARVLLDKSQMTLEDFFRVINAAANDTKWRPIVLGSLYNVRRYWNAILKAQHKSGGAQ
jgi:hypothetical protein